jgi:hypothetical protein
MKIMAMAIAMTNSQTLNNVMPAKAGIQPKAASAAIYILFPPGGARGGNTVSTNGFPHLASPGGLCTKTPFSSSVIPAKAGIHLLPFAVRASLSKALFTKAVGDGSRLSPG